MADAQIYVAVVDPETRLVMSERDFIDVSYSVDTIDSTENRCVSMRMILSVKNGRIAYFDQEHNLLFLKDMDDVGRHLKSGDSVSFSIYPGAALCPRDPNANITFQLGHRPSWNASTSQRDAEDG